jgi:hypothetical protein
MCNTSAGTYKLVCHLAGKSFPHLFMLFTLILVHTQVIFLHLPTPLSSLELECATTSFSDHTLPSTKHDLLS